MRLLVVQGPNVNRLGLRDPIYGTVTLDQVEHRLTEVAARHGSSMTSVQSNSQGTLIDAVQEADGFDAVIVNPGGLTNTGIALRDAIEDLRLPTAVVHVTNAARREPWRRRDAFADIADIYIVGAGAFGYVLALEGLHGEPEWLGWQTGGPRRIASAGDRSA